MAQAGPSSPAPSERAPWAGSASAAPTLELCCSCPGFKALQKGRGRASWPRGCHCPPQADLWSSSGSGGAALFQPWVATVISSLDPRGLWSGRLNRDLWPPGSRDLEREGLRCVWRGFLHGGMPSEGSSLLWVRLWFQIQNLEACRLQVTGSGRAHKTDLSLEQAPLFQK